MPKVNNAELQKEQEAYRLFEQKPITFIKTHNADEILDEFNKSIAVINNDPNYKGMSSSKAMEARRILIIQVMLQIYGNIKFGVHNTTIDIKEVPNMPGKLSNSFWINWFINMKPVEIMLGADRDSGNTFMYLLKEGYKFIAKSEDHFLTIYNAYCRNYLDEVCNANNSDGADYFKAAILGKIKTKGFFNAAAHLIWKANLSREQRIELLSYINDMVANGLSTIDIMAALSKNNKWLSFSQIKANARNSNQNGSATRYSSKQAAQTMVANINAAAKNQSPQGQALRNAILNLPNNILSQQAKQTLTSSLSQATNKLRLNED